MLKIIRTEDGSHSLFNEALNESYHSFHGALKESDHVFIENGLYFFYMGPGAGKNMIKVFEMGFGTGLNAILAAIWAEKQNCHVEFTTLESTPLSKDIIEQLNYTDLIPGYKNLFQNLHTSDWEKPNKLTEHFTLHKINNRLEDLKLPEQTYDVVFFDAFAPSKQPDMWTLDILEKIFECIHIPGVFVTYCAKGQLKRDLNLLGFNVESLPGPPGKKEMVRAVRL